jgi:isopentenyl-diphosphate Delta-isomerase
MASKVSTRKSQHLDIAIGEAVGFREKTTLLEHVQLVHNALPELDLDQIDLGVRVLGRSLKAPLIVAGMTGGTERATEINRELAAIAEERGYGFGLGSQRAMLRDPALTPTYQVRERAPTTLVLGNIGAVQATRMQTAELAELCETIGANALCVHLNPAMEVVQPEGDRDFRGIAVMLERLTAELPMPIVAKETGCGISRDSAERLFAVGVRHVDVSGAGGTSWVAVETLRASDQGRALGELFWDWGIPTAASLLSVEPLRFKTVIATGGIATGLDAARAIVLGASAVGIARPVLQAYANGGRQGALDYLTRVERELRTAFLLIGAGNVAQAQAAPRFVTGALADWQAHLAKHLPVR